MDFSKSEYWSVARSNNVTLFKDLSLVKEGWFKPSRFIKCKRLTNDGNQWHLVECYLALTDISHIETCLPSQVHDFNKNVEGYQSRMAEAANRQKVEDELRALHLEAMKKHNKDLKDGEEWKA